MNMIHLSKDQPTVMVNAVNVFTKIKAIDASLIEGAYDPQTTPFINLRLFNDFNVITFHMNLIPGSNKFNCYDVLQAANQVQNLENVSFNKLIIEVIPNIFLAEFSIRMQIDIEDEQMRDLVISVSREKLNALRNEMDLIARKWLTGHN